MAPVEATHGPCHSGRRMKGSATLASPGEPASAGPSAGAPSAGAPSAASYAGGTIAVESSHPFEASVEGATTSADASEGGELFDRGHGRPRAPLDDSHVHRDGAPNERHPPESRGSDNHLALVSGSAPDFAERGAPPPARRYCTAHRTMVSNITQLSGVASSMTPVAQEHAGAASRRCLRRHHGPGKVAKGGRLGSAWKPSGHEGARGRLGKVGRFRFHVDDDASKRQAGQSAVHDIYARLVGNPEVLVLRGARHPQRRIGKTLEHDHGDRHRGEGSRRARPPRRKTRRRRGQHRLARIAVVYVFSSTSKPATPSRASSFGSSLCDGLVTSTRTMASEARTASGAGRAGVDRRHDARVPDTAPTFPRRQLPRRRLGRPAPGASRSGEHETSRAAARHLLTMLPPRRDLPRPTARAPRSQSHPR